MSTPSKQNPDRLRMSWPAPRVSCGRSLALTRQWIAEWRDLVDFEVIPVLTSAEAAATMASR